MEHKVLLVATIACLALALLVLPPVFEDAKALPFDAVTAAGGSASRRLSDSPVVETRNRAGNETQSFRYGEDVYIAVRNMTDKSIWITARAQSSPHSYLMSNEDIKVTRPSRASLTGYAEIPENNYSGPIDDIEQGTPRSKRREVLPNQVYRRRWRPQKPGDYRIEVKYFPYDYARAWEQIVSPTFRVN